MILEGGSTPVSRIEHAYKLVLARAPQPRENEALSTALAKFQSYYTNHQKDAEAFVSHGKAKRDAGVAASELASYTAIASIILNSDEAITKE